MSGKPAPAVTRRLLVVDGLETSFLEAGSGPPVVLLHGGEFGASAELGWERVIRHLARTHRVIAPDALGFGCSAKVVDFVDGRRRRTRHVARLCELLGVEQADFVGNSMGAVMLLHDGAADTPRLPVRRMVTICGGGRILENEHADALFEYDGSLPAMRAIVRALFHHPSYPDDEDYVRRRHESSLLPGAWEAVAAARFRRPSAPSSPSTTPPFERIGMRTLVIEGGEDKLLPTGWSTELAGRLSDAEALTIAGAGHCPQIEQPAQTVDAISAFLA